MPNYIGKLTKDLQFQADLSTGRKEVKGGLSGRYPQTLLTQDSTSRIHTIQGNPSHRIENLSEAPRNQETKERGTGGHPIGVWNFSGQAQGSREKKVRPLSQRLRKGCTRPQARAVPMAPGKSPPPGRKTAVHERPLHTAQAMVWPWSRHTQGLKFHVLARMPLSQAECSVVHKDLNYNVAFSLGRRGSC